MEKLQHLMAEHDRLPAPPASADPGLEDIRSLLMVYDDRVSGVAQAVMANAPVNRMDLEPDVALRTRLAPNGESCPYEAYRRRLDDLLAASRAVLDGRAADRD